MSIVAEYSRYQWEESGGWNGVEDYVDAVTLWFFDYYDEDEENEGDRTETPMENGHTYVQVKTLLPYRHYQRRDDGGWDLVEESKEVREESIITVSS